MEKSDQKVSDEFHEFAEKAKEVIVEVKSVWPFDLFPDEAILNRGMFIVKRNIFFGISKIITGHHDDILDSHVDIGPLFGSVTVHMKYVTNGQETINWLAKNDARKLHAMLQGLLAAKKNQIELTKLSKEELIERLYEIGSIIDKGL